MRVDVAKLVAVLVGCMTVCLGTAQTALYRDVTTTRLPPGLVGPCMDAAAGDADGDGDLDLALAMEFEPNVLLLNDGSGRFTRESNRLPSTVHDSEDVAFADFDGDGDLDLVFVSEDDRTDELYINDGEGFFSDASLRLGTSEVSNALAVLDLDGDGAPDLLIGNVGTDRVLVNDRRGGFRDETAERWPQVGESRTQDLELADVDADGDLDVVVANEGQNELFLNRDGRLVDVTNRSLPARSDETREIRAADVDGDGDLDLVVANVQFGMQVTPQDYLLLNDGAGVFETADLARLPEGARSNFTVQIVDVDGDGDFDVLAPSTVFPDVQFEFLVFFADASGRTAVASVPGIDIRDVDGDGDIDAVAVEGDGSRTFMNEGGRLVAPVGDAAGSETNVFEDIDVDDDGEPDLATFTRRIDGTLQLVDIDRDGDVDIAVPRSVAMGANGDYLVLLNDGAGRFAAAPRGAVLPEEADGNGFDVEVADFDGDGATDLFLCNRASIAEPGEAERSGGQQRLLLGGSPGN